MFYPSLDFSLGLSHTVICHNQKSGNIPPPPSEERQRRGKSITPHSRRMVRSAAALLEEDFGRACLSFLTLTLPGLGAIDLAHANENFAELARQFCQQLSRSLARAGLSTDYVCVTEIQEKRWANRNELALHLHIVCQGRESYKSKWKLRPELIRNIWERVLKNVLAKPIECPAATRIERIKKSAKRYLGKYMSKGGKVLKDVVDSGLQDCLPPSWVRMSNDLRRRIIASIIKPSQEAKDLLIEHIENYKSAGVVRWFYKHYIDVVQPSGESYPLLVAVCGEFASQYDMNMFVSDS